MAVGKIVAAIFLFGISAYSEAQLHYSIEADFIEEITDGKTTNILSKGNSRYHKGSQLYISEYSVPTSYTIKVDSAEPLFKYSTLYRALNSGFNSSPATEYNYEPVSVEKKGKSVITTYLLPPKHADTQPNNQYNVGKIMTSQSNNRIDAEIMFNTHDSIIAKTFYYDYQTIEGVIMPTRIISVSYGETELYVKTIYSNIKLDQFTPESAKNSVTIPYKSYPKCEEDSKNIYNGLFAFYKRVISPQDIQKCSFYPSCSQYSKITFSQNGFFYGFADTFDRLLRCNGIHKDGYILDEKTHLLIDNPLKRKK